MTDTSAPPLAGLGRRVIALVVDWGLCLIISIAFFAGNGLATLGIFALEQTVLVGTLGSSIGHRLARIRIIRLDGRMPGVGKAALRAVLLCLVLPVVVIGEDKRSAHDTIAGTAAVQITPTAAR